MTQQVSRLGRSDQYDDRSFLVSFAGKDKGQAAITQLFRAKEWLQGGAVVSTTSAVPAQSLQSDADICGTRRPTPTAPCIPPIGPRCAPTYAPSPTPAAGDCTDDATEVHLPQSSSQCPLHHPTAG